VHGAPAQAQTDASSAPKTTGVLSESVRLALLNHPEISEANARVCQAIHRLGLGRALRRPQVNLTVSGSQQLFDRIRKDDPIAYKPRTSFLAPREGIYERSEKDRDAAASKRQFKRHEKEGVYDATVSLRYNLIDWDPAKATSKPKSFTMKSARSMPRAPCPSAVFNC
jgi:hypothetical protein